MWADRHSIIQPWLINKHHYKYFWDIESRSLLKKSIEVIHPRSNIVSPHKSAVSSIINFQKSPIFRLNTVPEIVNVSNICKEIRNTCKKSHRNANITYIVFGRIRLAIMSIIFFCWTIVISLKGALVEGLFPMLHVHHTCSCRVMANQNIISLIVINRSITIHDLSHDVSTNFAKSWAKDNSNISLEPAKARHKLMDAPQMIPGY